MSGQAELAPTSYADIASLLADNPDVDLPQARQADGSVVPVDDADNTSTDEQDLHTLDAQEAGTGTDPAADNSPRLRLRDKDDSTGRANDRRGQQFEVVVKGEDGKETTITVDHQERGAGYLRQADYTRKTQELASQTREAAQLMEGKLSEGMSRAAQCTQFAINSITQLAGFLTDAQMAALASTDPQAYIAETARVKAIHATLNGLQQQLDGIKADGEKQAAEAKRRALAHCWDVLRAEDIDAKRLSGIFDGIVSRYEVPAERFKNLDDPALVLIMRDALELHDLKAKATQIRKDGARAPVQQPRGVSSRNAGEDNANFARKARAGKAGINDLAKLIERLQQ
jgi:hypothetical protein